MKASSAEGWCTGPRRETRLRISGLVGYPVGVKNQPHDNLLASHGTTPAVELPEDPAVKELAEHGREQFVQIVARHPESSLCWALLAEGALSVETADADITAYAYARTGYHRGLDALRRAGWKGSGPIPWEHAPNRGFLRCLWVLAVASSRIGDQTESERCAQLLRDSSEAGFAELSARLQLAED